MAAPAAPLATPAAVSEPGGELRFVTVVFADLAGFTAFAEDRAPDEVAQIVGDLLQRLGQTVEHDDNRTIRGMILKVRHLVTVREDA